MEWSHELEGTRWDWCLRRKRDRWDAMFLARVQQTGRSWWTATMAGNRPQVDLFPSVAEAKAWCEARAVEAELEFG